MAIILLNCSKPYITYRSIIPNKYMFGIHSLRVNNMALSLAIWKDSSESISHSLEEEEVGVPLKEKLDTKRVAPWEEELEKEMYGLMLFFFISISEASIFLKHLDYVWPHHPQKLQCLSIFLPFYLVPLSPLWVGVG